MRMETGVCVLHLFCKRGDGIDRDAVSTAIEAAKQRELQVITASILGHKADVAVMALGQDVPALRELQSAMMEKTKAAAQSTDQVVHENPWAAVGVAVGLGLAIGLLIPRGR